MPRFELPQVSEVLTAPRPEFHPAIEVPATLKPRIQPSALRGHMFRPNPELKPRDSGGLFLFISGVSPLSPEHRGPIEPTITRHLDPRLRAVRRLGRAGTPKPAPILASIHHLIRSSREIHMGFSSFFIHQATWFFASVPISISALRISSKGPDRERQVLSPSIQWAYPLLE